MKVLVKGLSVSKQIPVFRISIGTLKTPQNLKGSPSITRVNLNPRLDVFGGTDPFWMVRRMR